MPINISNIIMMGDSLTDRGTLDNRYILGFIPMSYFAGLDKSSPLGRFTNGLAWSDHFSAILASRFIINELTDTTISPMQQVKDKYLLDDVRNKEGFWPKKSKHWFDATDIADEVVHGSAMMTDLLKTSYSLDNNLRVSFQNKKLVRNYNEGGLTAYDYSWSFTLSIYLFFIRLFLATLEKMRDALLMDDKKNQTTNNYKNETLVMEWSGGNDLITANEKPSKAIVDKAIKARMINVEELIKKGYKQFMLFELPDLSLTPRFQELSESEITNASECTLYFNQELARVCDELANKYHDCSIELFEVSYLFKMIYNNPESYGFDSAKRHIPYIHSKDFKIDPDKTSEASGYMFWDEIHPSADMHALIAKMLYKKCQTQYNFMAPSAEVIKVKKKNAQEKTHWMRPKNEGISLFNNNLQLDAKKMCLDSDLETKETPNQVISGIK